MNKKRNRFLLIVMSTLMLLAGCRAHKTVTKYGVPATKYGIPTSNYLFKAPITPEQKA